MQSPIRLLVLLMMIGLLALAGCAGDSDDEGDESGDETPAATETSEPEPTEPATEEQEATGTPEDEADPTGTPEADGEEEAEGDPSRRIEPHPMLLVTESGEQTGQFGPYFWTNEDLELAAEVQGGFFERQEEPLEVVQGEEISIETPADDFPNEMSLEVFPPTEPNDAGLVQMEPEPVSTEDLDPDNPVWTVELEPGDHYIELETVWPTNEIWGRNREVTYRYWITVTE